MATVLRERTLPQSPWLRVRADVLQVPADPTRSAIPFWHVLCLLAGMCGTLFFYGLHAGDLFRTESLRAVVSAEFLQSGNWLVPRLYGDALLTKPLGMYAAIAAVSWPLGQVTTWSARLPSALAASAMVLLFYWFVGRQFGRRAGLIAAVILPCSFLWLDKATAAEIDMLQVAWVSAALLFLFRAVEEEERREELLQVQRHLLPAARFRASIPSRSTWWWLASLACVAGGVLTKWTAPAFFYATAVAFLCWRGRLRLLFQWRHLLGLALATGLCLAWVAAVVADVGWRVLWETVLSEALPRLSHGHNARSGQVWQTLLHPFKILAVNLPWSGFALLTLWPGFAVLWDERGRRLLQAFHCWTWPNLLVWTLLPDHSTRHSFPLFPGIAGLAGMAWIAFLDGRSRHRLHVAGGVLALVGISGGTISCAAIAIWKLPDWSAWLGGVTAGLGILTLATGLRAAHQGRPQYVLTALILSWAVLKLAFVELVMPVRSLTRQPRSLGEQVASLVPAGQPIHICQLREYGILFYADRPVVKRASWKDVPDGPGLQYLALTAWERQAPPQPRRVLFEKEFRGELGEPMFVQAVEGEWPRAACLSSWPRSR